MSNTIVPVSASSGKSDPASTESYRLKPKHQTLQEWIEDTEYAIQALQTWLACLKRAHFLGRGDNQREQIIKTAIDPGQAQVKQMVKTVLTPTHPDAFEALLN